MLDVPALTARPYGRHFLLNPVHADFATIALDDPVAIDWDARLFSV